MQLTAKIEGVLLAHGEPIAIRSLARALGESEEMILQAVSALSKEYLENSRGFGILIKEDAVQLVSSAPCAEYIRKLKRVEDETTLSPAVLEVLSIIAYRAPITRAEIEAIRGVNCSSILRSLCIRGLVERSEQAEDARSFRYTPTFALLKLLGIQTFTDLPDYAELSRDTKLFPVIQGADEK